MDTESFWKSYVGEESPAEFMRRHATDNSYRAARAHVADLPHFFGIALKENWGITLNQARQLSREEVVAGLVEHLEAVRQDWNEAAVEFAVQDEHRFEPLRADQVDAFLEERIVFNGVAPIPMQNAEIDQLRPFKEMPLPKSSWFEEDLTPKVLVNAPTDQEIETRMLQKRSGVTSEVIEKYAALAGDDEEGDDEGGDGDKAE